MEFNHSMNRLLTWQFSRSDVKSREMEIRLKRAETGFSGITGHIPGFHSWPFEYICDHLSSINLVKSN